MLSPEEHNKRKHTACLSLSLSFPAAACLSDSPGLFLCGEQNYLSDTEDKGEMTGLARAFSVNIFKVLLYCMTPFSNPNTQKDLDF